MKKIIHYNLEILSAVMLIIITITAVFQTDISLVRRLILGFMALYTLHEWEEGRIPGGFYDLLFGLIGVQYKNDPDLIHMPVAIYLFVILLVPYFFDSAPLLLLPPLCLALFEGFIHTMGIIMMKCKKPYTPGMLTAWIMFVYAVWCIHQLPDLGTMTWVEGALLTVVTFVIMQRCVIGLAGYSYRVLLPLAKKNILGK